MSGDPQKIQELREAVFEALNSKQDDVDSRDFERFKNSDQWVDRFLKHHDYNVSSAMNMVLDTFKFRKTNNVNDINENNVRMDYLTEGAFFPRGRDKDGAQLLIFKCKSHQKGQSDMNELKRSVLYWFERLERQEKGKCISLFFDMEGCGLSNMDIEFTQYLITLFKLYYPYFLNYIIIFEMAWILNAAFKVIKQLLPEKALEKIKRIKKAEVSHWVPLDQALVCWGGTDDYVFSFVPESSADVQNNVSTNKKVHFADVSQMLESQGGGDCKDSSDGGILSISPPTVMTFVKEDNEYVSTVELANTDTAINISYKFKTTAPEKFRVRPSTGILGPGEKTIITVNLLPAYQIGAVPKDKFLIMSVPVENSNLSSKAIAELWQNTTGKNVSQHRLRCAPVVSETTRNGSVATSTMNPLDTNHMVKVNNNITMLLDSQKSLQKSLRMTQSLQFVTMIIVVLVACVLFYTLNGMQSSSPVDACIRQTEL